MICCSNLIMVVLLKNALSHQNRQTRCLHTWNRMNTHLSAGIKCVLQIFSMLLKSSLLSLVPSLPLSHTHHKEREWRRKPESRNKHPLTVSPVNRRHVQKKDMSEPKYEPTTPDSGCDRCFSYWPTLPAVLRGWVIIFVTIFIDKLWCTNSIIMKKRCQSSSNNIQSYRFKSQETCKWKKKTTTARRIWSKDRTTERMVLLDR